ncbi:MAG: DNA-directed RNA polymerase subunit H [Methanobrevibacter sp.]|uniref:DNA-directed RNA polymerase subunit H n=1 Tax=Methanobrevibacter sp. TaxID=66852 RepID=UPI0025EDB22E|nr:DNA-directed RNA polymerase subunit H [Methanobrevibacter sp.]MBE6497225.1 DNA-directed RNA polymerase subunit H [Methanobrevibacter sp.]
MKIDIQDHKLVPKHEIMSEEEISEEFSDVDYDFRDLPKIRANDPVVEAIGAQPGNVLRITRDSPTAGEYITYRIVEG